MTYLWTAHGCSCGNGRGDLNAQSDTELQAREQLQYWADETDTTPVALQHPNGHLEQYPDRYNEGMYQDLQRHLKTQPMET